MISLTRSWRSWVPLSAAFANFSCQFLRSFSIFSRVCSASCSGVSEIDGVSGDDVAVATEAEVLVVYAEAMDDEME